MAPVCLQARLLELLVRLLELPANLDYLLSCGELLPDLVAATRTALDHCNSLDANAPAMFVGGAAAARLITLLQVLVALLEHVPSNAALVNTQEQLVGGRMCCLPCTLIAVRRRLRLGTQQRYAAMCARVRVATPRRCCCARGCRWASWLLQGSLGAWRACSAFLISPCSEWPGPYLPTCCK